MGVYRIVLFHYCAACTTALQHLCSTALFPQKLTLCCFLITLLIMQGRGAATGYDNAVALPARADAEELAKENTKSAASGKGE
jgi:hypothetical protein